MTSDVPGQTWGSSYLPSGLAARTTREWFARRETTRSSPFLHRSPEDGANVEPVVAGRRSPRVARVEAALLVADAPLSPRRLVQLARLLDVAEARAVVEQLNELFDEDGTAFRVEWVAGGFQLLTRARYAAWLERLHERRARVRLSRSAMETLVVVAHRQPVTRADVDAVRGVQSTEVLRQLMERGLVRIVGEADTLGRPYQYGTTRAFLETFGLRTLADLPMAEELRVPAPVDETEPDEVVEVVESDSDDEAIVDGDADAA